MRFFLLAWPAMACWLSQPISSASGFSFCFMMLHDVFKCCLPTAAARPPLTHSRIFCNRLPYICTCQDNAWYMVLAMACGV